MSSAAFVLIYPIVVCNALTLANEEEWFPIVEDAYQAVAYAAAAACAAAAFSAVQIILVAAGVEKQKMQEMSGAAVRKYFRSCMEGSFMHGMYVEDAKQYCIRYWKIPCRMPVVVSIEEK